MAAFRGRSSAMDIHQIFERVIRPVSNIVAQFPAGTRVTVPEHCVDWVVTDFGAARLKFLNLEQRAAALIELAHPKFRDELARQAHEQGLRLSRVDKLPPPPASFFSKTD